jgi:hypothetical protein
MPISGAVNQRHFSVHSFPSHLSVTVVHWLLGEPVAKLPLETAAGNQL